jgi:hypothetical protein
MIEQYAVKLNYKKPDGYWKIGEEIFVDVETDVDHKKANHFAAEAKAKEIFPNCEIVRVTYC